MVDRYSLRSPDKWTGYSVKKDYSEEAIVTLFPYFLNNNQMYRKDSYLCEISKHLSENEPGPWVMVTKRRDACG